MAKRRRRLKVPGRIIGEVAPLNRRQSPDTSLPDRFSFEPKWNEALGWLRGWTTLERLSNLLGLTKAPSDVDKDGRGRDGLPAIPQIPDEATIRKALLLFLKERPGILSDGRMQPEGRSWPWKTAPLRDKN